MYKWEGNLWKWKNVWISNAMYKCIKKEKWMKMESVWKKKEWCRRWDVCMNKHCIDVKRRGNEWKWKNELMNRWEMYEHRMYKFIK